MFDYRDFLLEPVQPKRAFSDEDRKNRKRDNERKQANRNRRDTPGGNHIGGVCLRCSKPLNYWLTYQLCDKCLNVRVSSLVVTSHAISHNTR